MFYRNTHIQPDVFITEDNTAYGLTVFSQDNSDIDEHPSDYLHVYDMPQQWYLIYNSLMKCFDYLYSVRLCSQ